MTDSGFNGTASNRVQSAKQAERPNIFQFATKELSQDAVLSWLCAWGDSENKRHDSELHELGRRFVEMLVSTQYSGFILPEKCAVTVCAQEQNIDIVVRVEVGDAKYAIIIEDKIDASLHNALDVYRERVEHSRKFKGSRIIPIVLKTGEIAFHETLQRTHKAKYAMIEREDLLNFFKENEQLIHHPFIIDFRDSLQSMQDKVMSYLSLPIAEWTPTDGAEGKRKENVKGKDKMKHNYSGWYGFYRALSKHEHPEHSGRPCPFNKWHEVASPGNFISCETEFNTDISRVIPD